jgi:hypothetical protein
LNLFFQNPHCLFKVIIKNSDLNFFQIARLLFSIVKTILRFVYDGYLFFLK